MNVEETLASWTGPSSVTEREKQKRTERMVGKAIAAHEPFEGCRLSVYAKGSYANNTNVRADSDVDIAVQCHEAEYWEQARPGLHTPGSIYQGPWAPSKLRSEVGAALKDKFGSDVDDSGSTAFLVKSSTARVDADVVPCFDYRYYLGATLSRTGTKVFRKSGQGFVNYPVQQLQNGNAKNTSTLGYYKRAVRVLKRIENAMVTNRAHRSVPSFFMECLVYNSPNPIFLAGSWSRRMQLILAHILNGLQGSEPQEERNRWLEANGCKFLFHSAQVWTRADGREFAAAAWNYLGFGS